MKKSITFLLSLHLFISFVGLGQDKINTIKRSTVGFNLGFNYGNLTMESATGFENSYKSNLGIQLGILTEHRLSRIAFLSPRIDFTLPRINLEAMNLENSLTTKYSMPLRLEFMTYIIFRDVDRKLQPYFFGGPAVKTPIANNLAKSRIYTMTTDVAFDLGIGCNKSFKHLQFAPELKYSFGLINLANTLGINKMHQHTLSLILNLKN